jgi:hypothetical protein
MQKHRFTGTVRPKKTQEIVLPGRDDLFLKAADWPAQLAPGTLTVEVNGLEQETMKQLDDATFRPALVIPARHIIGNPLRPDSDHPTRGFASVWRAELQVAATGQIGRCWMFRIIGSDAKAEIELVAEDDLRSRFNVGDGAAVKVTVWEEESNWKPPTPHEIIADWIEAARGVESDYGVEKAMGYLIGEKFLNFLEVAEQNREWREAIPTFVAEIKALVEPWKLAEFLNTPRRLGPMGHTISEEGHRAFREQMTEEERIREDARNLMLLEWTKELLMEE